MTHKWSEITVGLNMLLKHLHLIEEKNAWIINKSLECMEHVLRCLHLQDAAQFGESFQVHDVDEEWSKCIVQVHAQVLEHLAGRWNWNIA